MRGPRTRRTVAVIGAGLAGLRCASVLQAAGYAVTVFEQAPAPGGRMRALAGQQWHCDHGAQYFTARDPDFMSAVGAWIATDCAAPWPARLASWDGTTLQPSLGTLHRFVGVPDMAAPALALAVGLDLRTETRIDTVQRTEPGWTLRGAGLPEAVHTELLVLALPAPQAAALLETAASDLARVAARVLMQPAWAVMARFTAPVEAGYDGLFVNAGPLRWIARNSSKPGRVGAETWLLHATAAWSHAHRDARPAQVIDQLLPELQELGLPVPLACEAFFWEAASTESPAVADACVWDAASAAGLCGDWLAGGKVEGAWCSGTALAQRICAYDAGGRD
ncbi:NAD(P)/FAD-dependent oxidoreductase [Xanthomonas campestris]|uniref:NAD(P)/FAD-dependent oxidoreductase n=1 Tax=Xanthomonas campestris TaxID=339 RepID=UPI003CEF806B